MEYPVRKKDSEVTRPDFARDTVTGWDLERRVVLTREPEQSHYTVTALTDNEIEWLLYFWERIQMFLRDRSPLP